MKIVKFKAEHLQRLDLQDGQKDLRAAFGDPEYGMQLQECAYSFSAIADDGEVLGAAGVQELWEGRAIAWALLSRNAGPHFKAIHRAASGFLAQAQWRRIEMVVEDGFAPAHRWAKMLGMEHEGVMRAYSPSGKDFHMYARVKHG